MESPVTHIRDIPLIVIVGPTASGKTALAIELAERYNGEIISADSRAIYKEMDIGTAKPTSQEQLRVKHWGIDLVNPNERFNVADFKEYAIEKIHDIRSRGRMPFLVGGSGLYVDSVIFDYNFPVVRNDNLRVQLEKKSIVELQDYCRKNNIELPQNINNKRYLIGAIERKDSIGGRRAEPIENTIVVGLTTNRTDLKEKIAHRAENLFKQNVVKEAALLGGRYGWEHPSMTGNIYPLARAYLNREITEIEMKEKFTTLDWQLAKRQVTWFKRNKFIKWGSASDLRAYLEDKLVNTV